MKVIDSTTREGQKFAVVEFADHYAIYPADELNDDPRPVAEFDDVPSLVQMHDAITRHLGGTVCVA